MNNKKNRGMNEIPMSRRDHVNYDRTDFTYISRWSHIPLPENNRIMKYLRKNFKPLKNLSYKIIGQPALYRHITPLPNYKPDVVTSDVVKNDLIIHVCASVYVEKIYSNGDIYIHIPKDYLDDPDPKCDFSMITDIGALSKENMYFSEVVNGIRGYEFETLKKIAETI